MLVFLLLNDFPFVQKRHPSGHGEPLDVIMNDDDEGDASAQLSHQEVWAVFEGVWSHVYQIRWDVLWLIPCTLIKLTEFDFALFKGLEFFMYHLYLMSPRGKLSGNITVNSVLCSED